MSAFVFQHTLVGVLIGTLVPLPHTTCELRDCLVLDGCVDDETEPALDIHLAVLDVGTVGVHRFAVVERCTFVFLFVVHTAIRRSWK